jgi:hypothetical protein
MVPLESPAEKFKVQEVEIVAKARSRPEEEVKNATFAQDEENVQINMQEGLGKPHVDDADPINKESSELKEAGLGEDLVNGPPQDGNIQAVEE